MEFDFLSPINQEIIDFAKQLSSQHLGSKIVMHSNESVPDLDKINIAIIGVLENRGDKSASGNANLDFIRKELYNLYPGNWDKSIADLGDILEGNKKEDTYFAMQSIISQLLKKSCIAIIIGGTQDLTYPMYRAYDKLEQMVNIVAIDSKFDLGREDQDLSVDSYLTRIIVDEPNNLFNYSNVGFQSYYNSQEELDLIEKLHFDKYRLGEISSKIELAEPILRDADLVTIDLQSVKSSSSANFSNFIPNGFDGKEVCSLSRYAGISDKVSSIGVFNHTNTIQESALIAQIIWYFIEGVQYRSNEFPFGSKDNYIKYIVPVEEDEIVFYKSNKTDRWWIEISFFSTNNNKIKKQTLLPCSHDEYLVACNQEIPERWWKAQKKNIILI